MPLFGQTDASISKAIQGPDYVMLVGYFVLMLGIGLYFYRFMRGMKVYFTGGNKIPWWLAGVSFYMSSFSAYAFVIYSGLCFKLGWVGVTLFWVMIPATIISVTFFATRWRRARIDSPVEFLESRYSALVRQLFVWLGLPVGIIDDSLKLIATGTIVHVGMGFSIETSIVACGLIMLAYTFMGGLWAVTVTDFVQFVILAVAVLALFPLSIAKAGGVHSLVAHTPPGFFALSTETYNWYYIALLVGLYAVAFSSTHWHLIQKYFCVPTEKDAKKVGWLVTALYVVGPPLFFMPAIAARAFMPDIPYLLEHDKEIYPRLCAYLLPVGMLGLIIAAMFSATMGNLSSHFNVRASVLTNDVYRRLLRPHAGEKELVTAGRGMTIVVGGLTIMMAIALAGSIGPRTVQVHGELVRRRGGPLGASADRRAGFPPRHAAKHRRGRNRRRRARCHALPLPAGIDHDLRNHLRTGSDYLCRELRHGDGDHVRNERDLAHDGCRIRASGAVSHAAGNAHRRTARRAGGSQAGRGCRLSLRHRGHLRGLHRPLDALRAAVYPRAISEGGERDSRPGLSHDRRFDGLGEPSQPPRQVEQHAMKIAGG